MFFNIFKRHTLSSLSFIALVALVLLGACKKDNAEPNPTTGTISGKFTVCTNGICAQDSQLKDWDITLKLYPVGSVSAIKTVKTTRNGFDFSDIAPGNYEIEADGFVNFNGTRYTAEGSSGAQVQVGKTASMTINLN